MTQASMTKRLRDVKRTAEFLDVSDRTVRNLVKRGELSHVRIGCQLKFRDIDIQKYLERQAQPAGNTLAVPSGHADTM